MKTDYLQAVFDPFQLRLCVDRTVELIGWIRRMHTPVDAIAFTGVSGGALAWPISFTTGIPLICVRKTGENSHTRHSIGDVEGYVEARSYLIVDDMVASGATLRRLIRKMKKVSPNSRCVGVVLYNPGWEEVKWLDSYALDGETLPTWCVHQHPSMWARTPAQSSRPANVMGA